MKTVTISPRYQIVIPETIRHAMGLRPGTKVRVFQYQNRIEFVPEQKMRKMRGFLKGIDTRINRESDRV